MVVAWAIFIYARARVLGRMVVHARTVGLNFCGGDGSLDGHWTFNGNEIGQDFQRPIQVLLLGTSGWNIFSYRLTGWYMRVLEPALRQLMREAEIKTLSRNDPVIAKTIAAHITSAWSFRRQRTLLLGHSKGGLALLLAMTSLPELTTLTDGIVLVHTNLNNRDAQSTWRPLWDQLPRWQRRAIARRLILVGSQIVPDFQDSDLVRIVHDDQTSRYYVCGQPLSPAIDLERITMIEKILRELRRQRPFELVCRPTTRSEHQAEQER